MAEAGVIPPAVLARLADLCLALPEAYQELAWAGTRWRVRGSTFAHVVAIADGYPVAYAKAAATEGPAVVLTFRSAGEELEALTLAGPPYFRPGWGRPDLGIFLDDATDWDEVAELVTDSYCLLAPKKLAAQVAPPTPPAL